MKHHSHSGGLPAKFAAFVAEQALDKNAEEPDGAEGGSPSHFFKAASELRRGDVIEYGGYVWLIRGKLQNLSHYRNNAVNVKYVLLLPGGRTLGKMYVVGGMRSLWSKVNPLDEMEKPFQASFRRKSTRVKVLKSTHIAKKLLLAEAM